MKSKRKNTDRSKFIKNAVDNGTTKSWARKAYSLKERLRMGEFDENKEA